jgi:hypothetical protein
MRPQVGELFGAVMRLRMRRNGNEPRNDRLARDIARLFSVKSGRVPQPRRALLAHPNQRELSGTQRRTGAQHARAREAGRGRHAEGSRAGSVRQRWSGQGLGQVAKSPTESHWPSHLTTARACLNFSRKTCEWSVPCRTLWSGRGIFETAPKNAYDLLTVCGHMKFATVTAQSREPMQRLPRPNWHRSTAQSRSMAPYYPT